MLTAVDTNIISDLVKNPAGRAATRMARIGARSVTTSVIVAGEIRFGLLQKGSAKLTERVEAVVADLDALLGERLPVLLEIARGGSGSSRPDRVH